MERFLTRGEMDLLRPIFMDTIPYDDQLVTENTREWGGPDNSITPDSTPQFASSVWTYDFSRSGNGDKWIFIHEMTHAWQWYHGRNNVLSALKLMARFKDYEDAYDYDLNNFNNLLDFNFEQQASIIPDYWFVLNGLTPKQNKGMRATLRDYKPYIMALQQSGAPSRAGYVDHSRDYHYRTPL